MAAAGGEAKNGAPAAPLPADNAAAAPADRDAVLGKVELERKLCVIKAWEESEKSNAENKCQKKLSAITSWEKTRRAAAEAKLRAREEKLEKKKAEYAEKMRNQAAAVHRRAEEKRACVVAERHHAVLRYQDMAASHRSKGTTPPKNKILLGCIKCL